MDLEFEEPKEETTLEAPKKNYKKNKVITVRFSEKEKQLIDITAEEYETTITELVRKAVFYYLDMLNGNKKILGKLILYKELSKFKQLKNVLEVYEKKLTEFKNTTTALGIPHKAFKDFIEEWKKNNLDLK